MRVPSFLWPQGLLSQVFTEVCLLVRQIANRCLFLMGKQRWHTTTARWGLRGFQPVHFPSWALMSHTPRVWCTQPTSRLTCCCSWCRNALTQTWLPHSVSLEPLKSFPFKCVLEDTEIKYSTCDSMERRVSVWKYMMALLSLRTHPCKHICISTGLHQDLDNGGCQFVWVLM